MEDKFLLSDDELDNVVGGFVGKEDAIAALTTAMNSFKALKTERFNSIECKYVVDMMYRECENASSDPMPQLDADYVIKELESLNRKLAAAGETQVADKARTIIDELKSSLGL